MAAASSPPLMQEMDRETPLGSSFKMRKMGSLIEKLGLAIRLLRRRVGGTEEDVGVRTDLQQHPEALSSAVAFTKNCHEDASRLESIRPLPMPARDITVMWTSCLDSSSWLYR